MGIRNLLKSFRPSVDISNESTCERWLEDALNKSIPENNRRCLRCLKSQPGLRTIHHCKSDHIEGYLFIEDFDIKLLKDYIPRSLGAFNIFDDTPHCLRRGSS